MSVTDTIEKGTISMRTPGSPKAMPRLRARPRRLPLVLLGLLAAATIHLPTHAAPLPKPARAAAEWRATRLTLPASARPEQTFDNRAARICFDRSRPHTFFISE